MATALQVRSKHPHNALPSRGGAFFHAVPLLPSFEPSSNSWDMYLGSNASVLVLALTALYSGATRPLPNDVKATDRTNAEFRVEARASAQLSPACSPDLSGQEKDLIGGAAVDMHLLPNLPFHLDIDVDRREYTRNRRRGEQHITKKLQRTRIAA